MLENDVQLIRRVLLGDDSAFSTLVQKHQKGVHALVWRKVKDFHYAEEITQDVFVQVYKKLGTLKDPKCFAGWLYVIAKRLSLNWIQRHKPAMPSLEETPVVEIEESSYNHYMSERRETEAAEHRSEVASEILETLPESERTVVTLHYLGEMTTTEISKYLGVSVNTIKSRLRRGRERLQTSESLVRQMLGGVQLSADLTERVMREVADINPTAPPAGKPLIPWTAFGAAAVLILLILGAGNQYLARFQKPYSFDAQSEPTVEIVDAPITLDIIAQPAIRRQFGQTAVPNNSAGAGTQVSEATLRSRGQEDSFNLSTAQWTQTGGPLGGHVRDIFATSQGNLYAFSGTEMYKLASNETGWTRVNAGIPIVDDLMPMVENRGTLYVVSTDEIFASADNGETWNTLCLRPKGTAIGLIIHATQERNRQTDMTMYLALRDEGIYRSTDAGKQWKVLDNGLMGDRMTAFAAVGNTVFAGTNQGLYRLDSDTWNLLPVGASETVYSLAVSGNNLYAGMGLDLHGPFGITVDERNRMAFNNELSPSKIFHSDDLGASWTDITPKHKALLNPESGIQILAIGETLLALGKVQFRSTDNGKNWTFLGNAHYAYMLNYIPSVAVNDKTFYKVGVFGIHRTTNGGESWDLFMNGVRGTRIVDMVTFNNRLYAYNGIDVSQSIDGGESWKSVNVSSGAVIPELVKQNRSGPILDLDARLLVANNILYFLSPSENRLHISGLSTDGDVLIPIQSVPALESEPLPTGLLSPYSEEGSEIVISHIIENTIKSNTLAISGDMFYLEFRRTLFKWKLGDPTWTNTGFVDTPQGTDADEQENFKLAVLGETVYVGKRDGKLFQSLDEGNSWKDLTPNLPLRFNRFNDIVFAGSTVCVATDKGVLVSRNGEHWQTVTDTTYKRIVINQLAVDAHTVYGINDIGVFHLNTRGQWEQISSEVPDEVISLTILNNRLYGVTEQHGMFHMLLESIY